MPKLKFIRTEKHSDSESDVWTVFPNLNSELKHSIINAEPIKTFNTWPNEEWTIDSYEGDEVKCVSGRNVKYFSKADVDEYLIDSIKEARVKAHDPIKTFFEQYGILFGQWKWKDKHYDSTTLRILLDGTSEGHFGGIRMREIDLSLTESIELKVMKGSQIAFIEINDEGDFVNRDYNFKLKDYTQETIHPTALYDKLLKRLKSLGDLEMSPKGTQFFNDKFCYIPWFHEDGEYKAEFRFTAIPKRDGAEGYQKYSGDTIYKKPKKTTLIKAADLATALAEYLGPIKTIIDAIEVEIK